MLTECNGHCDLSDRTSIVWRSGFTVPHQSGLGSIAVGGVTVTVLTETLVTPGMDRRWGAKSISAPALSRIR